jgi:hypothetical protein
MAKLKKECKPRPLEGTWSYRDIIGSTISLSSLPVVSAYRKHMSGASRSQELRVEDIVFRVSRDGKILPLYKLEGLEEYYPSNILSVLRINSTPDKAAICGWIMCGETLCGYKCESIMYGSNELLGSTSNGVTIVNDDGSIVVKERTINIVGATVEDPNTDTDDVTKIEINFKGDILD